MKLLGGSGPDVAGGLLRHRLLNGLVTGMPPDHGHAMLWAPVRPSNTRWRPSPPSWSPVVARSNWTAAAMPDLSGRTAIATGANTGLGLATAAAAWFVRSAPSHS